MDRILTYLATSHSNTSKQIYRELNHGWEGFSSKKYRNDGDGLCSKRVS